MERVYIHLGEAQAKIWRSDWPTGPEESPFTVTFQQPRGREFVNEKVTQQRKYQQRQHADKSKL